MKINASTLFAAVALLFVFQSCEDDITTTVDNYTDAEYNILSQSLDLPRDLYDYTNEMPTFAFQNETDVFSPFTHQQNHLATLGRVLFYDDQLSINNTVSCASCHQQQLAFADDAKQSIGFNGELSLRNSLPLGNTVGFDVAYGGSSFGPRAMFGWDEANLDIASQSEAAITSTLEMGMHDLDQLTAKLQQIDYYRVLNQKAFGHETLSSHSLLQALDAFINSIASTKSPFDEGAKGKSMEEMMHKSFNNYTDAENAGKELYMNNCSTCHSIDHSKTAVARASNGLDLVYEDKGVGAVTGWAGDDGVFKVPFLRNIELTAPYMHDGRFETIDEVLDFYSEGIQDHKNLAPQLKNGSTAKKFSFTTEEKSALKAYMLTLTDESIATEQKWSDPFR